MENIRRLCVFVLVPFLFAGIAGASETPPADTLSSALTNILPSYWKVTKVVITAKVDKGDDVNPKMRLRFVAGLEAVDNLYLPAKQAPDIAPFVAVVRTEPRNARETLYGTATAVYRAGDWEFSFDLENRLEKFGRPRVNFGAVAVPVGSSSMNAALEQVAGLKSVSVELEAFRSEVKTRNEKITAQLAEETAVYEQEKLAAISGLKKRLAEVRDKIMASDVIATELTQINRDNAARKATLEAMRGKTAELQKTLINERERQLAIRKQGMDKLIAQIRAGGTGGLAAFEWAMDQSREFNQALAIRTAFNSNDPPLVAAALWQVIKTKPNLALRLYPINTDPKDNTLVAIHTIRIEKIDLSNHNFWTETGMDDVKGMLAQETLSIRALNTGCNYVLRAKQGGRMAGVAACEYGKKYQVILDFM